jgi:hypothetical protein
MNFNLSNIGTANPFKFSSGKKTGTRSMTPVVQPKPTPGVTWANTTAPKPVTPAAALPAPDPKADAWNTIEQTTKTNAGATKRNTLAQITYGEGRDARDGGFKFNYKTDADGNQYADLDSVTVDYSDPFSKMSLLQKAYEDTKRGSTNSYAAQGQLYSGSYINQQNSDNFNDTHARTDATRDFLDSLKGSTFKRVGAQSDYDTTVSNGGLTKLYSLLGLGS